MIPSPGMLQTFAPWKSALKDAAAINTTRWALFRRLKLFGLPVETGSGGLTKFNRVKRDLPKEHWIDAACVGQSTPERLDVGNLKSLRIKATGHNSRQMCRMDKYGFPRTSSKSSRTVKGFRTGDFVKAVVPNGKHVGVIVGRVAVRSSGSFNIVSGDTTKQGINWRHVHRIHASDGYNYQY
ncbi:MAG: hypothetical protein MOB07_13095 [Acidobacteria bacterium]|nr:hypothetical protein [Acidobacteriota bacterium]